ncbi:MAG: choice-of-anchor D domain-containing protein [Actinobacteria bacterium]|nr:choice-of-anchor D domain-containing protein [Actinomycetota bacterium]
MGKGGSFWSSIPGVLTGLAGVLTAVVTLVTLAFSQGWIGEGPADDAASGQAGGDGGSASVPDLGVDPESLRFRPTVLGAVSEEVAVSNEGDQPFTVDPVAVTGEDAERFDVDDGECAGESLRSGRSCTLRITFDPSGIGEARATLVVSVNGGQRSAEVALDATGLG